MPATCGALKNTLNRAGNRNPRKRTPPLSGAVGQFLSLRRPPRATFHNPLRTSHWESVDAYFVDLARFRKG
jgi:hypothetical protein